MTTKKPLYHPGDRVVLHGWQITYPSTVVRKSEGALEDDDRIDVYESTEEINFGRASRVIRATIVGPPRARQITFENGTDRASMEQLGATIHVAPRGADQ